MKKYKNKSNKKPTDRVGFYIALSVCLMAVGFAVWSTYTSVSDYLKESKAVEYSSQLVDNTEPETSEVSSTAIVEDYSTEPTQAVNNSSGFELTEQLPTEESSEVTSELDDLQAVLKVTESMIYPVKSQHVSEEYSEDAVYSMTMKDFRAHTGVDFMAAKGEEVYSMCDGVVSRIYTDEHYGVVVEVSNAEYKVYYCGLSDNVKVKVNSSVKKGDVIATAGDIPVESKDPSHIHIEIKVGDKYIDPLAVIMSDK